MSGTTLWGEARADTFILGNRNHVYYAIGGHADMAYLSDFEVQVDQVVLHGTASDYYLESGEPGETWLYLKSGESVAGFATNGTLSLGQFKYLA